MPAYSAQHEGNLRNHLRAAGLPSDGAIEDWAADPKVKQYILDQMLTVGRRAGLQKSEMIKDIVFTTEEWSVVHRHRLRTSLSSGADRVQVSRQRHADTSHEAEPALDFQEV